MEKKKKIVLGAMVQHLKSEKDFDLFFTDILTPQEYDEMLDRFLICQELMKGATVQEVCDKLDVASATVVRGNRVLKYGAGKIKKIVQR